MNQPPSLLESLSDQHRPLIDRAKMLATVNTAFSKLLPKSSRKYIVIMNFDKTSVIIAADTATHLTHLRFEHQNLLTNIRQIPGLEGVTQLHFKIQPTTIDSQKNPVRKAVMSQQTSQLLRQSAEGFEDPQLRSALLRLSKNCASSS